MNCMYQINQRAIFTNCNEDSENQGNQSEPRSTKIASTKLIYCTICTELIKDRENPIS